MIDGLDVLENGNQLVLVVTMPFNYFLKAIQLICLMNTQNRASLFMELF